MREVGGGLRGGCVCTVSVYSAQGHISVAVFQKQSHEKKKKS